MGLQVLMDWGRLKLWSGGVDQRCRGISLNLENENVGIVVYCWGITVKITHQVHGSIVDFPTKKGYARACC